MAQSLSQIYVHTVFSTKNRERLLSPAIRRELYLYFITVLKNLECPVLEIGGTDDHIHILCILSKNISASDLVKKAKVPTSTWIKTKGPEFSKFAWQGGYGVFSIGESSMERAVKYIKSQEEHHKKASFQDEFRRFLQKYNVPFDERYVWD